MHVFRVVLKDKNKDGGQQSVDLAASPEHSLTAFAQAIKAQGGVANEAVVIPYENILFVLRMDLPDTGINAPAAGSA